MTEQAAIAIMGLLIYDLEKAELQTVLQIGNGGDYLIRCKGKEELIQVEVSGVKEDATGRKSRTRLTDKTSQVLKNNLMGFASVTTFSYQTETIVHSYLHCVVKQKRKKGKKKGKQK